MLLVRGLIKQTNIRAHYTFFVIPAPTNAFPRRRESIINTAFQGVFVLRFSWAPDFSGVTVWCLFRASQMSLPRAQKSYYSISPNISKAKSGQISLAFEIALLRFSYASIVLAPLSNKDLAFS